MAKKLTVLTLLGFVAFCATIISGAAINFDGYFVNANQDPESVYTEVLDKADAPTDSTTYVDSIIAGGTHSQYTYTKVKAAVDKLCTLDAGGAITKVEEALGLECVNVTFEGSLNVETRFEEAGEVTTYSVTSGVQLTLCGNYISLVALNETTIEEITLVYACSHSFETEHNLLETEETVLNGTDEDRVWKCQYCDYTEVRVDPNGFSTYRNGSIINPLPDSNSIVITKETTAVGGVEGSYAVTGAASTWNDKVEAELTSHKNASARKNITDYQIKAISFDIYADSNATGFRIASPFINSHTNNYVNFVGYTYNNSTNTRLKILDPTTLQYVGAMNPNKWYTFVIEMPDLEVYPSNQYHCVEIVKIDGTFHYANVRYWHTLPRAVEDVEFVWANTSPAHVGTYELSETAIGGRENVHAYTGTGIWNDQLDINWTNRTNTASTGVGTWQDIFYMNKYNNVKSYSVDVYLPAGSTLRVQGADSTTGKHLTNLLTAGGTYTAFNNGTFNTKISVVPEGGTALAEGDAMPADTWYTITWDLSNWLTSKYEGSAYYLNASLVAPKGTIGVTNLRQNLNA